VLVAVQFLTRIPVRVRFEPGDLRRAVGAFPAVGALIAAIGIGVRWALTPWVDVPLATIGSMAAMVVATGALHEDGFADAADGLWGGRTPEERLRIMRDSRLGTYGTVALVFLLATKFLALAPMTQEAFAATLIPAMVLGRASSLVLMRMIQPAPDGVATLAGPPSPLGWLVAGVTCALSLAGFGIHVWLPVAAAALAATASITIIRRKTGAFNGDQLGAANQLVEVSVLLAGAAVFVTS
jgi:adenosylcobinamide-GDP ribazoletransferase